MGGGLFSPNIYELTKPCCLWCANENDHKLLIANYTNFTSPERRKSKNKKFDQWLVTEFIWNARMNYQCKTVSGNHSYKKKRKSQKNNSNTVIVIGVKG